MKKQLVISLQLLFFVSTLYAQTFKAGIVENLLGPTSLVDYVSSIIFAFIGVFVSLMLHATKRDVNSTNTPVKFSFWFLLKDNWKRLLTGILMVLVCIRFLKELTGLELNMFYAFAIGFCNDKIIQILKVKTSIFDVQRTGTQTEDNSQTA